MDYVDWVEEVLGAVANAWRNASGGTQLAGVFRWDIVKHLPVGAFQNYDAFEQTERNMALINALGDLDAMGLVRCRYHQEYSLTQEGNKYPRASLRTAWPKIMEIFLDEEQQEVLAKAVELAEVKRDEFALIQAVNGQALWAELGKLWDHDGDIRCLVLEKQLKGLGLVAGRSSLGSTVFFPTYIGIVRATRQAESELVQIVRDALKDWETTNVDFKGLLNLNRDNEKAEFIRDILGLATTKSYGRRFLIIGFDDKTHEFSSSVSDDVTQDRMEDILNAYVEKPAPRIKYNVVPWGNGKIGIVEIFHQSRDVPYKVAKSLGGKKGSITRFL